MQEGYYWLKAVPWAESQAFDVDWSIGHYDGLDWRLIGAEEGRAVTVFTVGEYLGTEPGRKDV
jgi:hypothetical protein